MPALFVRFQYRLTLLRATLCLSCSFLLLGACGFGGFAPAVAPVSFLATNLPDRCGLAPLDGLTGQPFTTLADYPLTAELRVIWPGQDVTTEQRSERLNAQVADDGRILRLFCG